MPPVTSSAMGLQLIIRWRAQLGINGTSYVWKIFQNWKSPRRVKFDKIFKHREY